MALFGGHIHTQRNSFDCISIHYICIYRIAVRPIPAMKDFPYIKTTSSCFSLQCSTLEKLYLNGISVLLLNNFYGSICISYRPIIYDLFFLQTMIVIAKRLSIVCQTLMLTIFMNNIAGIMLFC